MIVISEDSLKKIITKRGSESSAKFYKYGVLYFYLSSYHTISLHNTEESNSP